VWNYKKFNYLIWFFFIFSNYYFRKMRTLKQGSHINPWLVSPIQDFRDISAIITIYPFFGYTWNIFNMPSKLMDWCIFDNIVVATRFGICCNPKLAIAKITRQVVSPHAQLCVNYWFYPIFLFTKVHKVSQSNLQWGHRLYPRLDLNVHDGYDLTFLKVQSTFEAFKLLCAVLVGPVVMVRADNEAILLGSLVVLLVPNVLVGTDWTPDDHETDRILGLFLRGYFGPIDVPIVLGNIDTKGKAFRHRWRFYIPPTCGWHDHKQRCSCD